MREEHEGKRVNRWRRRAECWRRSLAHRKVEEDDEDGAGCLGGLQKYCYRPCQNIMDIVTTGVSVCIYTLLHCNAMVFAAFISTGSVISDPAFHVWQSVDNQ